MRRCAFLTLASPADYVVDDDLAHAPMRAAGWDVVNVPWRQADVQWGSFDAVVIRSTYDYVAAPDEFIAVLERIARSGTRLFNSLDLVRWNLRKTYLRDLHGRGVPIVPTAWRTALHTNELPGLFDEFGTDEIIVKPVIGANAGGAYRIARNGVDQLPDDFEAFYAKRHAMIQPFLRAVVDVGEYSLFYFDGEFSHAILKTPMAADFRVQEEHGGNIRSIQPDDALLAAGNLVLAALQETPLYARVDLVPEVDAYLLMELELIEPSLYFRMDERAGARFAEAVTRRTSAAQIQGG